MEVPHSTKGRTFGLAVDICKYVLGGNKGIAELITVGNNLSLASVGSLGTAVSVINDPNVVRSRIGLGVGQALIAANHGLLIGRKGVIGVSCLADLVGAVGSHLCLFGQLKKHEFHVMNGGFPLSIESYASCHGKLGAGRIGSSRTVGSSVPGKEPAMFAKSSVVREMVFVLIPLDASPYTIRVESLAALSLEL